MDDPDLMDVAPICSCMDGECQELAVATCDECGAWLCEGHVVLGAVGGAHHHLCEDCC